MRYYNLIISDPKSGQVWKPSNTANGFTKSAGGSTFTSFVNGQTLPGALNIEFDFPVFPMNQPQGQSWIRVWGVGLGMIGQAANLNGANFQLSAGMQKGLPLANPAQAGLIMQGTIFQAYGNWQGVNQTLELICNPGAAGVGKDIQWNWPANTSLASAIAASLTQAFPGYKQSINIASLILPSTEPAHYNNIWNFGAYLTELTQVIGAQIYGQNYSGVQLKIVGNTIYAYDSTITQTPIQLAFQDLVGQPTWIDPATVNLKTVLRSDIAVGTAIKFPPGITSPFALTSQAAAVPNAPASSKTAFQGVFTVNEAHHFGNFRQADANSWVTTFNAVTSLTTPAVGAS